MRFFLVQGALVLVVFAAVCGCDRQSQYAVLTTVFTGVPPMEELYAEKAPGEKATIEEKLAELQYKHPLWAANQCTSCHVQVDEGVLAEVDDPVVEDSAALQEAELEAEVIAAATGRKPESVAAEAEPTEGKMTPAESEAEPGGATTRALLMPADKLCISCHLDKTARRAIRERLWLHNPVAMGECLSCHAEHQSANPAHLRYPVRELCSTCHSDDQLPLDCGEGGGDTNAGCLSCHNAHMGRNRSLLSREYTEVKNVVGPVPGPAGSPAISSPFK